MPITRIFWWLDKFYDDLPQHAKVLQLTLDESADVVRAGIPRMGIAHRSSITRGVLHLILNPIDVVASGVRRLRGTTAARRLANGQYLTEHPRSWRGYFGLGYTQDDVVNAYRYRAAINNLVTEFRRAPTEELYHLLAKEASRYHGFVSASEWVGLVRDIRRSHPMFHFPGDDIPSLIRLNDELIPMIRNSKRAAHLLMKGFIGTSAAYLTVRLTLKEDLLPEGNRAWEKGKKDFRDLYEKMNAAMVPSAQAELYQERGRDLTGKFRNSPVSEITEDDLSSLQTVFGQTSLDVGIYIAPIDLSTLSRLRSEAVQEYRESSGEDRLDKKKRYLQVREVLSNALHNNLQHELQSGLVFEEGITPGTNAAFAHFREERIRISKPQRKRIDQILDDQEVAVGKKEGLRRALALTLNETFKRRIAGNSFTRHGAVKELKDLYKYGMTSETSKFITSLPADKKELLKQNMEKIKGPLGSFEQEVASQLHNILTEDEKLASK